MKPRWVWALRVAVVAIGGMVLLGAVAYVLWDECSSYWCFSFERLFLGMSVLFGALALVAVAQRYERSSGKGPRVVAVALIAAAPAVFVAGFWMAGDPHPVSGFQRANQVVGPIWIALAILALGTGLWSLRPRRGRAEHK